MNSSFLHTPLAVFGLGTTEIVLILLVVLLLFGATKLPGLAKGLGQSIQEFKKASKGEDDESSAKTTASTEASKKTESTRGSN
jgi:sec-independent protein translocase protein TatA